MKNKNQLKLLALSMFPAALIASAQTTYYWDSNGLTAGFGNTTGTWGTSAFWGTSSAGTGATANTATTALDTINFGTAALNYGNGAVAVAAGGVTVGDIVVGAGQTTALTLGTAGNAITLHNGLMMNTGAAAFTLSSPTTLGAAQTWTNHSANTLTISGAVTNGGNLLTVDGSGFTNFTSAFAAGAGGLTKNGSGRIQLNNAVQGYTGDVTVNGGVLSYGDDIGRLTASGNITINGGVIDQRWQGLINRSLGAGASQIQILGGASGFSNNNGGHEVRLNNNTAYEVVWGAAGENGNVNATGFFNPSAYVLQSAFTQNNQNITLSNLYDLNASTRTIQVNPGINGYSTATFSNNIRTNTGTAGITKTGGGILILSGTNTYNGGTTINAGILKYAKTVSMPSTGNVTVNDGTTLAVDVGQAGEFTNATSGAGSFGGVLAGTGVGSSTVTYSGDVSVGIDVNGTSVTYAGNIANPSGATSLSLVKLNGNNLTLTGASTYTGRTKINGGAIQVGSLGNTGLTSSPLGVNNTAIDFIGSAGELEYTGAGETSNRLLDITGTIGTLRTSSNSGALVLSSAVNPTGTGTKTLTLLGTSTLANTISGNISNGAGGTLGVTKNLSGTWVLSGVNTYTANTLVSAGTLELSGGSAILDTGTVNMTNAAGAVLKLNESETIGSVTGGGALGGDVNLQGFNLTVQPTASGTLAGDLIGNGNLIKRGSANYVLQGDNALFTGKSTVEVGYLVHDSLTADNGAGELALNGGNFSMGAAFAGQTLTIGSLSGNSATSQIDPNFGAATGTKTLSVNQTTDGTYQGKILTGTGGRDLAFTKTGAATLTLRGANTYAGTTTVSGGTLLVNGSTLAAGLVIVSSGATLGGNGTVGNVTVANGFLSPGDGLDNTFGVNSLALNPTATLVFGLDDPFSFDGNDLIQITDSLILAGQINIHAQPGGSGYDFLTATAGTQWLVMTYSPGNLASAGPVTVGSAPALSSGLAWSVDTTSVDGSVFLTVVVPEPAAASLMAAGLLVLLLRRRRLA